MRNKISILIVALLLGTLNLSAQSEQKFKIPWGLGIGVHLDLIPSPFNRYNVTEDKWAYHYGLTEFSSSNHHELEFFLFKDFKKGNTIGIGLGFQNEELNLNFIQSNPNQSFYSSYTFRSDINRTIGYKTNHWSFRYIKSYDSKLKIGFTFSLRQRHGEFILFDPDKNMVFGSIRTFNGEPLPLVDFGKTLSVDNEFVLSLRAQESYRDIAELSVKELRWGQFDFLPSIMVEYPIYKFIYCRFSLNLRLWSDLDFYNLKVYGKGNVYEDYFSEETLIYELHVNNKVIYPKLGVGVKF